jgi:hypothetical protein
MLPEKSCVLAITLTVGVDVDQRHGSVMVRVPKTAGKHEIARLARQLAEEQSDAVEWTEALVNGSQKLRSFRAEPVVGMPDSGAVVECQPDLDGTWTIEA